MFNWNTLGALEHWNFKESNDIFMWQDDNKMYTSLECVMFHLLLPLAVMSRRKLQKRFSGMPSANQRSAHLQRNIGNHVTTYLIGIHKQCVSYTKGCKYDYMCTYVNNISINALCLFLQLIYTYIYFLPTSLTYVLHSRCMNKLTYMQLQSVTGCTHIYMVFGFNLCKYIHPSNK